jgi:hypothetical protein
MQYTRLRLTTSIKNSNKIDIPNEYLSGYLSGYPKHFPCNELYISKIFINQETNIFNEGDRICIYMNQFSNNIFISKDKHVQNYTLIIPTNNEKIINYESNNDTPDIFYSNSNILEILIAAKWINIEISIIDKNGIIKNILNDALMEIEFLFKHNETITSTQRRDLSFVH